MPKRHARRATRRTAFRHKADPTEHRQWRPRPCPWGRVRGIAQCEAPAANAKHRTKAIGVIRSSFAFRAVLRPTAMPQLFVCFAESEACAPSEPLSPPSGKASVSIRLSHVRPEPRPRRPHSPPFTTSVRLCFSGPAPAPPASPGYRGAEPHLMALMRAKGLR